MSEGTVIADGTPRQVFSKPEQLQKVGLSVPQTTQLIYTLNQAGCTLPLDALSTDECAEALYRYFKNSSLGGS